MSSVDKRRQRRLLLGGRNGGRGGHLSGAPYVILVALAATACTPVGPTPPPAPAPAPARNVSGAPTPSPTAPPAPSPTTPPSPAATVVLAGTQVTAGTYGCTQWIYPGGNLASTGYNLVIGPGDSYRSSLGTDSPGTMVFTDATHFSFSGGFLDGYSGDYLPGPGGHIDYHPAADNGRFGCYPQHS